MDAENIEEHEGLVLGDFADSSNKPICEEKVVKEGDVTPERDAVLGHSIPGIHESVAQRSVKCLTQENEAQDKINSYSESIVIDRNDEGGYKSGLRKHREYTRGRQRTAVLNREQEAKEEYVLDRPPSEVQHQPVLFHLKDLKKKSLEELLELAESLGVNSANNLQRHDLVFVILKCLAEKGMVIVGEGVIEILQDGYGFLRSMEANYIPCPDDIYVSSNQIRRFLLRTGDTVVGPIRPPKKGERYFTLTSVTSINNIEAQKSYYRIYFDDLTPLYPNERIMLETSVQHNKDLSARIIDIVAPIGKGQRELVVAPPRTGKTMLIQNIAHSIASNYPDIYLIVLLIDERPEEVTDMSRSVRGEVVSSTFDEPSNRHVQLAEMVIEKAKRLVEGKKDVVILLDSITRLARAYNNIAPSSGKVLSGGVDSNALQRPKRFFGAARNIEEGGSLTIIATALIETGSRMDEVIFEEFKGTGNSEIVLDRRISDKRIFPAIDITKSGTRKEELLLDKATLSKIWVLRRIINPMGTTEAIEFLIDKLRFSNSNAEFFDQMNTYNGTKKQI